MPPNSAFVEERLLDAFEQLLSGGNPGVRQRLVVDSLSPTTWPDGCLGADRPNVTCQGSSTRGYEATIDYLDDPVAYTAHADEDLGGLVWIEEHRIEGTIAEFTGSGWLISGSGPLFDSVAVPGPLEVVIVFGTEFLSDRNQLQVGSPVTLGIAPLPGASEMFAVVWITSR